VTNIESSQVKVTPEEVASPPFLRSELNDRIGCRAIPVRWFDRHAFRGASKSQLLGFNGIGDFTDSFQEEAEKIFSFR
jgi:hypothetical protein